MKNKLVYNIIRNQDIYPLNATYLKPKVLRQCRNDEKKKNTFSTSDFKSLLSCL